MIGALILPGVLLVLLGAAVSTVTVEAAPGRPQKRPLTTAAIRAWNAAALAIVVAGIVVALIGATAIVTQELGL